MSNKQIVPIKFRQVSESYVAGKQRYRCANKPGSYFNGLSEYACPLWKHGEPDSIGRFDMAGFKISRITKHCNPNDGFDDCQNMRVFCTSCHSVKKHSTSKINDSDDEDDDDTDDNDTDDDEDNDNDENTIDDDDTDDDENMCDDTEFLNENTNDEIEHDCNNKKSICNFNIIVEKDFDEININVTIKDPKRKSPKCVCYN